MWSTFSTYQLLFGELTIFEIHVLLQHMYTFQYKEFKICGIDHVPHVVHFMNSEENKEQQK